MFNLTRDSVKAEIDRSYTWFKPEGIKTSQGSYAGKLLHGDYKVFNEEMDLLTSGAYHRGLKNGQWVRYSDDKIALVRNYKNGELEGEQIDYEHGREVLRKAYKRGVPDGSWYFYEPDSSKSITFKKGMPVDTTYIVN